MVMDYEVKNLVKQAIEAWKTANERGEKLRRDELDMRRQELAVSEQMLASSEQMFADKLRYDATCFLAAQYGDDNQREWALSEIAKIAGLR